MPASAGPHRGLDRALPLAFVLIWSTGFVVARFGMPHAPPLSFLSMRYAISLLCFTAWVALARVKGPRDLLQWCHLAVVGVLVQAGYLGGVWAAVKAGIGAGTVSLLVGLQPVLTALWLTARSSASPTNAGHRIGAVQWCGLGLGLCGLTLVVWNKLGSGELTALNFTLALAALLSVTIGTLYQKRFVVACDVRSAAAVQLVAALAVSLPFALLETERFDWQNELIGAMAWSVLVLTMGGGSLLYMLIQRGAATEVTSLMFLVPPCTSMLAWWLFGEDYTWNMWLGLALTAAGVAMVVRTGKRAP